MLGSIPSTDDVTPLDARRIVVDRRGRRLGEPHTLEELAEVQNLASRRRVDRAVVFCILDFHKIGALLYNIKFPDVDRRDELFPHSESAKPESRSRMAPTRRR